MGIMGLKMAKLTLIHEELGVVAIQAYGHGISKSQAIQRWKYKYGKKMAECRVESEGVEMEILPESKADHHKKLQNIQTGEIYHNQRMASIALGISEHAIRIHAKRQLKNHDAYLVRYAE